MKQREGRLANRRLNAKAPRWVKVFGIIGIVMVLLVVLLHLTGHGFGSHMHHTP